MSGETENSHFLHFLNMISFQSRHRGRTASYPTIPLTRPRQSQSLPPSTHTVRTLVHLSDGRQPRTFDKLTSGLALVHLPVGGDERGGQLLVQRQHSLHQPDHVVVAGDVCGVILFSVGGGCVSERLAATRGSPPLQNDITLLCFPIFER